MQAEAPNQHNYSLDIYFAKHFARAMTQSFVSLMSAMRQDGSCETDLHLGFVFISHSPRNEGEDGGHGLAREVWVKGHGQHDFRSGRPTHSHGVEHMCISVIVCSKSFLHVE
jgi:hypothetical protein